MDMFVQAVGGLFQAIKNCKWTCLGKKIQEKPNRIRGGGLEWRGDVFLKMGFSETSYALKRATERNQASSFGEQP